MGSLMVYDHKNKEWIPYVADIQKWEKHFEDISQGRVYPDPKGRYIVGSGARFRFSSPHKPVESPELNMITPIAQTLEMAKSEVSREGSKVIRGRKRKASQDATIFQKDFKTARQ